MSKNMNETKWVARIRKRLAYDVIGHSRKLEAKTGLRLPYGYEIFAHGKVPVSKSIEFQTDLIIIEHGLSDTWKPRVVLEAKLGTVNTHDAITYSQKAAAHRAVHPYLRYGIILGNRKHYPLPGRLYRHGQNFDFMISFKGYDPTEEEIRQFARLIRAEIRASRTMEKIIYESRKRGREHYTILHRKLDVKL